MLEHAPQQQLCGRYPVFDSFTKGYKTFCGSKQNCECARKNQSRLLKSYHSTKDPEAAQQSLQKQQQTCLERYGVTNPAKNQTIREKIKKTNQIRYNADFPFQSKQIQHKIETTNLSRYGVKRPFENQDIVRKSHETARSKHGSDFMKAARQQFLNNNNNKNPFVVYQEKIKKTLKDRYDVLHPMQNREFFNKSRATLKNNHSVTNPAQCHIDAHTFEILEDKAQFSALCKKHSLKELAEKLAVSEKIIWARHDRYRLDCYTRSVRSQYEEEISAWLSDQGIQHLRNQKLGTKTVDFLAHNVAIEFNGLYAHSENSFYGKKLGIDRRYHYEKFQLCREKNIRLFTIFEDEWLNKKPIIKNQIRIALGLAKKGVPARKTTVCAISKNTAFEFLNFAHLQGAANASVYLGCYSNCNLIAAMTFLKKKPQEYELTRFATDEFLHAGVFSKMLAHFERLYSPHKIISFSDNRWSLGNVYSKTGFCRDCEIKPDYFVTDYKQRQHKFNWRKKRIHSRFGIDIENKTESQLTRELGWDRIWDCGKTRWCKTYNKHSK